LAKIIQGASLNSKLPTIRILGTRGVPAHHGGFETFAEGFSLYLVKAGWNVEVYCQELGTGPIRKELWCGVTRIIIPTSKNSSFHTILFDFKATLHATRGKAICLTLGYNTAIFTLFLRMRKQLTIMNMDGIEWMRNKWSFFPRAWLFANEWLGARLNHVLVADHPEISRHLRRHTSEAKIRMIPYGASVPESVSPKALKAFDLAPQGYALLIARPEPENSILEIVRAWSIKKRGCPLVVLGNYSRDIPYHHDVLNFASSEVRFLGAIYDKNLVYTLRQYAMIYLHGHTAGGTNPSLVEAMAFSNPIIAQNNVFNKWVAGPSAKYFQTWEDCSRILDSILKNPEQRFQMGMIAKNRQTVEFNIEMIHYKYKTILEELLKIWKMHPPDCRPGNIGHLCFETRKEQHCDGNAPDSIAIRPSSDSL
jgi:glycosyltransferase involved in cell wall biosynthesis